MHGLKALSEGESKEGVEDARDIARDMHISEVNEWLPDHIGCHGTYQKVP